MENKLTHQSYICFVAGHSGGHIVPCLTLAQQIIAQDPYKILFFSGNTPLDKKLIADNIVSKHVVLPLGKYSRLLKPLAYGVRITALIMSFFISMYYLFMYKPKKIISTGSIVAIPVCIAARILSIPIELFELNATPGKTMRVLAPLATSISTCFAYACSYFPAYKCKIAPYPVRFTQPFDYTTAASRIHIGLHEGKKTIFMCGGSQGSLFINNAIKQWLEQNPAIHKHIQIIHQTGATHATNWQLLYTQLHIPAQVFTYKSDLAHYYNAADLVICRSGAGTLFEVAFFKKPCITIPLANHITNHQQVNARAMAQQFPDIFFVLDEYKSDQLDFIIRNFLKFIH